MRPIWKATANLVIDVAATIVFFYAGLLSAPYAVGFAGAGMAKALSFIPEFSRVIWRPDQSFLGTALLFSLAAVYMMLPFAIGIEILRRLIGRQSQWLYAAGAVLVMAAYMHPDGMGAESGTARSLAVVTLLLAGTIGGATYWLVTIKLRAVLSFRLGHLICGSEPQAHSCAFS